VKQPNLFQMVIVLLAALNGCATTPPIPYEIPEPIADGKGRIVFMRNSDTSIYRQMSADVFVDGQEIGELQSREFLYLDVLVGSHTITAFGRGIRSQTELADNRREIEILVGQTRYFEVNHRDGRLVELHSSAATMDLAKLDRESTQLPD